MTVTNNLDVIGNTTFNDVNITGTLEVTIDISANGRLDVTNDVSMNSNVTIAGELNVVGGITGVFSGNITRTAITNNYTILSTDHFIGIDCSANIVTVTLPLAASVVNQQFIFIDETGSAGSNQIIIATTSSELINGQTTQPNYIII